MAPDSAESSIKTKKPSGKYFIVGVAFTMYFLTNANLYIISPNVLIDSII